MENAEAAVDSSQDIRSVHGQAEAGVTEVGERIPFHASRFVCRQESLLFSFRLVFFPEDAEHHLGVQPFLVEDTQVAVLLLNGLVELLEPGPEDVGQEDQQQAAGDQDVCETWFDDQQGHQCSHQPCEHLTQVRKHLRHAVCDDAGVVGEAVHPFGGVDGGHGSEVFAEHVGEQVCLEPVLHGGACQFEHVALHRSQSDEEEHQCDQQDGVTRENPYIARYGAVDEAPQEEGIPDDAHAQHRLHDRQENNM